MIDMPPLNHAILASHGTDDQVGAGLIHALVQRVSQSMPQVRIHETFVDVQEPALGTVLGQAVAADPGSTFAVVPLLLANGYHVKADIADAVGDATEAQLEAGQVAPNIVVTPALGPAAELVDLLLQRLGEAGWLPDDIVVLAVAGSSDANAVEESRLVHALLCDAITSLHASARVELAFLSAAEPRLKDLVPKLKFQNPNRRVTVANYLLAPGFFDRLARKAGAHVVAQPLLAPDQPPAEQLVSLVMHRIEQAGQPAGTLGCQLRADDFNCALGCSKPCR